MSGDRLTRQELSWLLTQEAVGAAERLRKGVQILTKQAPTKEGEEPFTPRSGSDRPPASERPVTLTSTGEDGEGLQSTLDLLDGAMSRLAELSGPTSTRSRRGRVDLAALLWEVAPDAKVELAPGSGTDVFSDAAELRRMLHVLLGATRQGAFSTGGGAQVITLRRDGDEVRLGVALGPDTAPISPAERGWLARMAIRFGGRYELDGSNEFLIFPALEAEEKKEVQVLRKELEAAKAQGEMYARELASVFAEEATPLTRPPPPLAEETGPALALATAGRLAEAFAEDVRTVFGPLGAARLKASEGNAAALTDEVQRALGKGAELLALARQMARIGADVSAIEVDLVTIAQDETSLATVAFASRGVVLTVAASENPSPLLVEGYPGALRAMVAEMLDRALRASRPGDEVRVALSSSEGGGLVVERIVSEGSGPNEGDRGASWSRSARAFLHEIARAHRIELHVSDTKLVARLAAPQ